GERAAAAVRGTLVTAIFAKVWNRLPRSAGSRAEVAGLARAAASVPAAGGARRDPRRPLCAGILRRAIRAAGGGGRAAGGAQAAQERRGTHLALRLRSAEFYRAFDARHARRGAAAKPRPVYRRGTGRAKHATHWLRLQAHRGDAEGAEFLRFSARSAAASPS